MSDTATADSAVVTGACRHGLGNDEHSRKLKWTERQRCTVGNIKHAQGKDTFVCLTHGITPDCTEVLRSLMDGVDVHSWMVRFKTNTSAELMPDRPDPTDREAILAFFRQTPSNTWYHQCDLGLERGSGGTGTVKPYKTLFESWAPAGSLKDLMTPDGPGTSDNLDKSGPSSVRSNTVSPDYELQLQGSGRVAPLPSPSPRTGVADRRSPQTSHPTRGIPSSIWPPSPERIFMRRQDAFIQAARARQTDATRRVCSRLNICFGPSRLPRVDLHVEQNYPDCTELIDRLMSQGTARDAEAYEGQSVSSNRSESNATATTVPPSPADPEGIWRHIPELTDFSGWVHFCDLRHQARTR